MANRNGSAKLLAILFLAAISRPGLAEETKWTLPRESAEKWSKRLREVVPGDWRVSIRENDLIVERKKFALLMDGTPNQMSGNIRETEGPIRLVLEFAPLITNDKYDQLKAVNIASVREERRQDQAVGLGPALGGGFMTQTPEDENRARAYQAIVAKLAWNSLPDLYTTDYSVYFYNRYGWLRIKDKNVQAECDAVQLRLLRYFGIYDPIVAVSPEKFSRSQTWATESAPWQERLRPEDDPDDSDRGRW